MASLRFLRPLASTSGCCFGFSNLEVTSRESIPAMQTSNGSGTHASRSAAGDVDVAVVGGGPGGLATAAAVLQGLGKYTTVKVHILRFRRYAAGLKGWLLPCALPTE